MPIKQIDFGTPEYEQMVNLRLTILRIPLGLGFSQEELMRESNDILIASLDEHEVIGCCILTNHDEQTLRLRQMAVSEKAQKRGLGASILSFAENLAHDKGYRRIMMHARDSAIPFYEKFGYSTFNDPFIEVNIPHHYMQKML